MIIAIAISTALLFVLVGLVALSRALKHAPVGFEDEFGFHRGIAPHNESDESANTLRNPIGPIRAA